MRHIRSMHRTIGARGAMLLTLSALWGWLFLLPLLLSEPRTDIDVFYYSWPLAWHAVGWAGTLAAAVVAAFVPPRKDWFGWVALTIMPAQRFFAWLLAGWEHTRSGGMSGEDDWWRSAGTYALIIITVWVAAAMRPAPFEPTEVQQPPEETER